MIFKTRLARENWNSKYRYDNETPLQTFQRVARGIAEVEAQYGASPETVEKWYDKFLKTLVKFEEVGTDARGEDIYHSAIDGKTYRAVGLKATMGGRITANVGTSYDKATPWNCFSGRETFVTRRGVMSFEETCGQEVEVLTTEGWEKARIQAFGEQPLFRYVMKPVRQQKRGDHVFWIPLGRSNEEKNVEATPDHRWILVNGQETTELREGDIVRGNVVTFPENELDLEHPEYREAFRHGLIFGDGYVNSRQKESTTFGIRLCGEKSRYEDLFDNKTYPPSYGGDPFCSVTTREKDYKKVPASGSTPLYIRGFIDGWASADGFVMSSGNVEISTQDEPALTWLRKHAALAGFFVVGYRTDSNKETNYGPRKAPLRRVILSRHEHAWKVIKKEDLGCTETVYCAVVPESRSFTLESGVYTGNCFIASPVSKAHIKYTKSVPNSIEEIITELETDESPDNLTNIFLSLLEAAETLRSEGGYGINFGFIRPRSSLIKGVGIRHPGVVSYMEIWDKMSEVIVKGDNDGYVDTLENFYEESPLSEKEKVMPRKGAMMAVLPIWHPDIEEFIRAKQEAGKLTKFNISVLVDDAFMEALEADGFYDLHFNGETYKRVKARDLYDLIMESTYNRSEPGILFFDNMNRNNPLLYLGPVSASNPCVAEGTLVATEKGLVPVEDIKVGDKIQTTLGFDPVASIEVHENYPVYKVTFSDGTILRVTEGHIFHSKKQHSPEGLWDRDTRLKDLEIGDFVRKQSYRFADNESQTRETMVQVESIEADGKATVYDLYEPKADDWNTLGIVNRGCGEIPGSSFIDKGYKPAPYLAPYMLEQEEHHIGFTTVCLLGSINLPMFVRPDRTFDYDGYAETVATFARMLDNVNDLGHVPLPSYRWAVDQIRQYGMGVNGPGSAMYMMGLRYGSPEAASFMEEVHRIKDDVSLRVSALLAQEKGPFPMYTPEYVETPYFREFCKASEETKDLVRKYGVRNAKRLTNPPLGNSSVICDSVSNGIEPVFSHGYERTVIADEWPEGLNRDNVKTILKEEQAGDATVWRGEYQGRTWYYEPHNRGLCFVEKIEDYGYAWVRENYPEDIENKAPYLVTAQDLPAKEHVAMQAVVQRYCDQSVSKTCNVPNDYSFEDFKDLYLEAWRAGLIGFTTYRAGTMEAVLTAPGQEDDNGRTLLQSLIEQGCVAEDCELTEDGVIVRDVRLPETFVNGTTQTVRREGNKYYFHLSYLPNDDKNPIALWIHSNSYKEGEYVTLNRAFKAVENLLLTSGVDPELVAMQVAKNSNDPYHTKLGKIIAMALRHNISIPHVVQALSGIEGDYIATTLTAVRKFLTEQIPDGTEIKGATCQVCQSTRLVYESGCDRCLDCGSSECT